MTRTRFSQKAKQEPAGRFSPDVDIRHGTTKRGATLKPADISGNRTSLGDLLDRAIERADAYRKARGL